MKSAIKGLVVLMLVLGMAAPALAIDGDLKGYYQIRGIAGNVNFVEDNNQNFQGVDQRIRLWFTGALNENVKGVFAIENDFYWGDVDQGTFGADEKANIEVKHAYIDFKVPGIDTAITAGTQGFSQGRNFVIGDDASGLKIVKKMGAANLMLLWIHGDEGTNTSGAGNDTAGNVLAELGDDKADLDYYSVQADFKAGGFSIVPLLGWEYGGRNEFSNIIFGGSADGKVADIGLAFTLLGSSWDNNLVGPGSDGFGVVAYGKASMDLAGIGVYLEGAYMGDEDAAGGQFQAVNQRGAVGGSAYNNFAEVLTGGVFDNRGTVGRQAVSDTHMNWVYGKLGAKAKIDSKSNVEGALIYAAEAVDTSLGTVDAKTYGFEIDAYYNRTIVDGLVMTVGGGYLFSDDEAIDGIVPVDDTYKVGTALTYKF